MVWGTILALYFCPAVDRCGESFSAQRCPRMNKSRCGKMFIAALALGLAANLAIRFGYCYGYRVGMDIQTQKS
jgi:hypothetical protein